MDAAAQSLLTTPRHGFLSHRIGDPGWSRPVPVWFEWTGEQAKVFSTASAPKVASLREDPAAHLLVANEVGEREAWVSITADVQIGDVDGPWIEQLAGRYWDLDDAGRRGELDEMLADLDSFVLLTLTPTRVRSYTF
jgi:hypothetical protein